MREKGDGEPLLLIHGLMTTSYSWRYLIDPLAEQFRVIAPDLVGCGCSDKPRADYGPSRLAEFIGELQDALGIRGCGVVGNSLGGYLCMQLALADPQSMRKLINIHSPGVPMARLYALKNVLRLPASRALLKWWVRRDVHRWAHGRVHYWDETVKSLEEARQYGDPLADDAGVTAFVHYLTDALDPAAMRRFVGALASFPVPLQLIYARRDPMVPPSVGKRLHALLPAAELLWLDDCSHFVQVDQPETLTQLIRDYFG